MTVDHALDGPGGSIVRWSWITTAVFTVGAVAAAAFPAALARPVAALDVALFAAGAVAFVAAYVRAVSRSRTDRITVTGVYLLAGSAPPHVRRALLGAVAVQSVVAVVTASVRLYTPVAFGVLVPVLGLGLAGLWASRHGTFPPRSR